MNDLSPVLLICVVIVGIWLVNSIKILREYERGVIFRLGRLLSEPRAPGWSLFSRRWTAWCGFRCVSTRWRCRGRMW